MNAKAGDNPHLWYAPATMPAVAKAIAAALTQADSANATGYAARLTKTLADLDRIAQRVALIKAKHAGKPVTATEPVFGLMADALGLTMRNQNFQLAMMNNTEPSARDVAAFEDDLKNGKVKALIYNKQVSEKLTQRLLTIARKAKVPVVARYRDAACQCHVPRLDARRTRRAGQGADGAFLLSAIVELENATLKINGRAVLKDISLAIEPGEFIGVLGPNGAGKTTLMRSILGLLPPSAGRVSVFGKTPQCGDAAIGYLPQLRTVLPDLRVRGLDYIASSLHGERWGLPSLSAADRAAIEATLDDVGARDLANRALSDMSGGERQRLLLAQALIGEPKLLLLDEPLISLDARHQEVVIDVIKQVCRERKITVLFSAHELNQLLGAIDRVLYLGNGQAVLGSVEDVVTAPVLSRLYGTEIEVLRASGHIFVLSRGRDVERADHNHDHGDGHGHAHHH